MAHVQQLVTKTQRSDMTCYGAQRWYLAACVHARPNALGDAYGTELVMGNVTAQVKNRPLVRQRRPYLSIAEAKRLLRVIDGDRLEALYVLALTIGLRRGELVALRWDDIDLRSRQLDVRQTIRRIDGKLQTIKPKASRSLRTVVLPRLAVRHLEKHKKRQDMERASLGALWQEHGLVFASSLGTPIEPRSVNQRWENLRRRAGLNWVRLLDLRHACETFLLTQGVQARAVMEILGRVEIGVTMNTNSHALLKLREEAADAIDELFGT